MGNRVWTAVVVAWNIVGVPLALVGLAGLPDDIRTWGRWGQIVSNAVDHNAMRWVLACAGIGIVVIANLPWRRWLRKQPPNRAKLSKPNSDFLKIDFDWDDAPDVCLEGESTVHTDNKTKATEGPTFFDAAPGDDPVWTDSASAAKSCDESERVTTANLVRVAL